MKTNIELARGTNLAIQSINGIDYWIPDQLDRFAELVRADQRERDARKAEARYQVMKETEESHYRLSEKPFNPAAFGFDMAVIDECRQIAAAIRAGKD